MSAASGGLLEGGFPGPGRAVVHQHGELGGEALGLPGPVAGHRGRADDQGGTTRRLAPPPALCGRGGEVLVLQEGQHRGRLAQPHVVGQAGAEAEALQHLEPGHAALLVGAELAR